MPVDPRLQAMLDAPLSERPTFMRQGEFFKGVRAMKGPYAARGYAAPPGTGPEGESCRTCKHIYTNHAAKTYYKCRISPCQSKTRKGDVSSISPACHKWEAKA
jgi:hypothetical protein